MTPPAKQSGLERRALEARPLVPRAFVVARLVAGRAEDLPRQGRARAGMAIRHDLRALRQADDLVHLLDGLASGEDAHVEVPRAGDVTLPRIAPYAARSVVLRLAANVQHRQCRIGQSIRELRGVDVHNAATTSSSSRTAGRCESSVSHSSTCGGSSTSSRGLARAIHGRKAIAASTYAGGANARRRSSSALSS